MLMIRLQRVGRKHEPVFRLVLTDSKNSTKSGKFLEILGNFDSRTAEKANLKGEKIKEWIAKGAKLSDTVHNMLVEKKIIQGKKINKLPKKRPIIDEGALKAAKEAEEAAKNKEKNPVAEEIVATDSEEKKEELEPSPEKNQNPEA